MIPSERNPCRRSDSGFSLVTTLLVMSLLVIMVVALLGLRTREAEVVSIDSDREAARANALFALETALGELQRYAGPDQAVSARADLLAEEGDASSSETESSDFPNPNWTGIWSTTPKARESESLGAFLVSGNEQFDIEEDTTSYPAGYLDPEQALDAGDPETLRLVSGTQKSPEREVLVRRQPIPGDPESKRRRGHFAYWVGDEGIKARVDLVDPYREDDSSEAKRYRFGLAQQAGIDGAFPEFDVEDERIDSVSNLDEIGRLSGFEDEIENRFHDYTTRSRGLLTDTRNGGLKRDLTLAFEEDEVFERLVGARRTGVEASTTVEVDDIYRLDTSRLRDFYLVPKILDTALEEDSSQGRWKGGPNWGSLREHYLLYKEPAGHFPFLPHPRCAVRMRQYAFNPYKHRDDSAANGKKDYYQRNSPVVPVLARAQMNLRLRGRKSVAKDPNGNDLYEVDLEIQPVVAIWNPHNVTFTSRAYRFDWEISTTLRIRVGGKNLQYDLYRMWNSTNTPWFSLDTETVTLQPGEIRLFTIDQRKNLSQRVVLVPRWSEEGAFRIALPSESTEFRDSGGMPLRVRAGEQIAIEEISLVAPPASEGWSKDLKDLQKHNTFMAIKYAESPGGQSSAVESSSVRMNNLWKADDESGPGVVPPDGEEMPPFVASRQEDEPYHLAAWAYVMRTSREDDLGHRDFIDSNVRAIAASSRWDGSVEDRGWRTMGWLNDGASRALLPPGNVEPEADGLDRYRGFGGDSIGAEGETHLVLFDVPREPLVSIGQLQHANIGRYNNEPSFVVGNSYHNVRIPLGETEVRDFAVHDTKGLYSSQGLDIFDLSYRVNEALWDSWFFSTVDYSDLGQQLTELREGRPLPNSRFRLFDPKGMLEPSDFSDATGDDDTYGAIGARLLVDGAFNVNSTSVESWRVLLHSIRNLEIPVYDPVTDQVEDIQEDGIVFSRFSRPYGTAFSTGADSSDGAYWRGYRRLEAEQIDELAEEIVRQVKLRGPFRSMADFVNRTLIDRDPSDDLEDDTRLSGTLQAAFDRVASVNGALDSSMTFPIDPIPDSANEFHDVPEAGTQGTGFPGYLMQGDVLQSLGPTLTARSDTFRIRAYGDRVIDPDGTGQMEYPIARVWCEAIVQRLPEPFESLDETMPEERQLAQRPIDIEEKYRSKDRPYFGRRFRVVSFRWLNEEDL